MTCRVFKSKFVYALSQESVEHKFVNKKFYSKSYSRLKKNNSNMIFIGNSVYKYYIKQDPTTCRSNEFTGLTNKITESVFMAPSIQSQHFTPVQITNL